MSTQTTAILRRREAVRVVPALTPHGSAESPTHIRQYALSENSATACFYSGVNAPLGEWRRLHQTVMRISRCLTWLVPQSRATRPLPRAVSPAQRALTTSRNEGGHGFKSRKLHKTPWSGRYRPSRTLAVCTILSSEAPQVSRRTNSRFLHRVMKSVAGVVPLRLVIRVMRYGCLDLVPVVAGIVALCTLLSVRLRPGG